MTEKFKELMIACEIDRLEQIEKEVKNDEKYKVYERKEKELYKKMVEAIPEDLKKDFEQYGDALYTIRNIYGSFSYRNGFGDCADFMNYVLHGRQNVKLNITIT